MMLREVVTLLVLVSYVQCQGGDFGNGGNFGVRPWMKPDKNDKKGPVIAEEPVIVNLNEKNSQEFDCPIPNEDGNEFATWYRVSKNGRQKDLVFEEGKYDFETFTGFKIININTQDEGTYICRQGDEHGPIIKKFSLIIMEATETTESPGTQPPVWQFVPKRILRAESRRVIIARCSVTEPEGVTVSMYRLTDGGEILKKFKDPAVVLHRPDNEDAGQYKCVAENAGGKIEYQFQIEVRVNGRYSEWEAWGPCDKECGLGFKIRNRKCNNPKPSGGGRECTGQSFERLPCRARSCQKPFLRKFGYEITKDMLHLSCKASGIPTPSVQWYFNGRPFPMSFDGRNPEFKIPRSRARDGSYSCRIRNDIGFLTMYINIKL